ncbi:MAG: efflux RND transporter periplasmic adaptor subunit [Novosphingobium sp.]|nr:efflux RND transporter periplasmic adaptor subunit [Novosphingobium sp.]
MNYEARIDAGAEPIVATTTANPLDDGADERRGSGRTILVGVAVLLALVAIWFLLHRKPAGVDLAAQQASQAATVSVVAPGRTTVAGTITAPGTLAARHSMPVGSVGEGGQIVQVLVNAGNWVRQGQILAVIDRSVQNQQQAAQAAQIQVAVADARLAQANLDRALKLIARGFISKAQIDQLTATRDAANARVKVARAQLGQIGAQIRRLNIVAPAAGLVLERNVEPGQVVSGGGTVLFRIAEGGQLEMQAKVSETDLAKLSVGVPAEVTPVGATRAFQGQIWQLSPTIDPQTRQGTARIALAYAPELRPGGFATAVIHSGTVVAPVLPESAILSDANGSYVYVVNRNDRVERRPVKTGTVLDAGIAVTEGLTGTERVVLRAGAFLNPGDKVHPVMARR